VSMHYKHWNIYILYIHMHILQILLIILLIVVSWHILGWIVQPCPPVIPTKENPFWWCSIPHEDGHCCHGLGKLLLVHRFKVPTVNGHVIVY
jgi:hypothetical protein